MLDVHKKRDSVIDIAKEICIFFMVLGHAHNSGLVRHYIYIFHMPFFFFVSGFFFNPHKSVLNFLEQKTRRLLFPIIGYSIFSYIINLLLTFLNHENYEEVYLGIGPSWFLWSLWMITCFCYFFDRFCCSKWVLFFMGVVDLCLAYYFKESGILLRFYLMQTMFMLPFFVLGYLFYGNMKLKKKYAGQNLLSNIFEVGEKICSSCS